MRSKRAQQRQLPMRDASRDDSTRARSERAQQRQLQMRVAEGGRTRRRERRGAIGGAGQVSRRALTKSTSADSVDAVLVAVCGERRWTLAPHFFAIMWISSSSVETHTCGGPTGHASDGEWRWRERAVARAVRAAREGEGWSDGSGGHSGSGGGGGGDSLGRWLQPRLVKDARVLCGLDDPVDERPALQDLDVLARDRDGAASRGDDGHDTRHDVAVKDGRGGSGHCLRRARKAGSNSAFSAERRKTFFAQLASEKKNG